MNDIRVNQSLDQPLSQTSRRPGYESLSKFKEGAETVATSQVGALQGNGAVDVRVDGTPPRCPRTPETETAPASLRVVCAVPQTDQVFTTTNSSANFYVYLR